MTTESRLRSLPSLPAGVTVRAVRWSEDGPALVALANEAAAHDGVERRMALDQVTHWLSTPSERFDAARDMLVAELGGEPVGFALGGWEVDNDGGLNYSCMTQVRLDQRGSGLWEALLARLEEHQREVAARAGATEVAQRLESWVDRGEADLRAVVEGAGYQAIRWWAQMERPLTDLPAASLPDGLEFRPAREELLRRYWEVTVEVFHDHFGSIDDTEHGFLQTRDDPRRDLRLWAVVHDGDEVVGLASNRIDHAENAQLGVQRGWINGVAVLRPWRRRGIGAAIVVESMRLLAAAGMDTARLGVDADNPHGAVGLYERLGFVEVAGGTVYRKPLEVTR